ncbi:hypothetical protein NKG94_02790 [Micromonospora sp. M12]
MTWHLHDEDLRAYATRTLAGPVLWSAEAHLAACGECRERLAGTATVDLGWAVDRAGLASTRPWTRRGRGPSNGC